MQRLEVSGAVRTLLRVVRRQKVKDPQEVGCWYVEWFRLAQDRDRWRTLVSAVMNLGVP